MSKKKNNTKITIFIIIVLLLCIVLGLVFSIIFTRFSKDNDITENTSSIKGIDDFTSVKEIIEYFNSNYIGEEKSKEDGYTYKYNVKFAYNLYENNKSQEKFFVTLVNRISYFLKYKNNYILFDEEKNIEIKVKCNGKRIIQMLINGEDNYFVKHDNLESLKSSKNDSISNFSIKSEEVNKVIRNNWEYDKSVFGKKDSTFNNFDIYGDEGFEVKSIQGKVYNIVITSNYKGKVIDNIDLNYELEEVINQLGKPTFGDSESYCIGYKNENAYVFFTNEKMQDRFISIFRNEDYDSTKFEELLKRFFDSEIDIKTFMNELTYLWPDYYDYNYTNKYLKIRYPNKGVSIEFGENTSNQIVIYDNYKITDYTKHLLNNSKVVGKLEESQYLELEEERLKYKTYIEIAPEELYEGEDIYIYTKSNKYGFVFEKNNNNETTKVLFISKDRTKYFNKEFKENVYRGFFINDDFFVYSIQNKGIYVYNVITEEKTILIEGEEDFYLKNYSEGNLYYDETSISLEME